MTSTTTVTDTRGINPRNKKPRDDQNGHRIILKTMVNKKQKLVIEFVLPRPDAVGFITQFDNYTITLLHDDGSHKTYFKHAILCFSAQ